MVRQINCSTFCSLLRCAWPKSLYNARFARVLSAFWYALFSFSLMGSLTGFSSASASTLEYTRPFVAGRLCNGGLNAKSSAKSHLLKELWQFILWRQRMSTKPNAEEFTRAKRAVSHDIQTRARWKFFFRLSGQEMWTHFRFFKVHFKVESPLKWVFLRVIQRQRSPFDWVIGVKSERATNRQTDRQTDKDNCRNGLIDTFASDHTLFCSFERGSHFSEKLAQNWFIIGLIIIIIFMLHFSSFPSFSSRWLQLVKDCSDWKWFPLRRGSKQSE